MLLGTVRRQATLASGAAGLVLCTLLALWGQHPAPASSSSATPQRSAPPPPHTAAAHAALPASPFGAMPAGVRAAAETAPGPDTLLQPGLRDALEALLLDAGEAPTPQALKERLAPLIARHFTPAQAARALELAGRYVDYRVALGTLAAPADMADPDTLGNALQARRALRQRYFDGAEYSALFQEGDALDTFTLARLQALHNADLSAAQRQAALQRAEAALPEAERTARAAATQQLAVAAQTATFDAQGLDDQARYAARRAQYGDAAAQALARLDGEERDWQARLSQYAQAQSGNTTPQALATLRQQLFTPQEQLRLDAALALRSTASRQ